MNNSVLLIGNGLNRCYYHELAWGGLLSDIAHVHKLTMNGNNSFPMEFEYIVYQILKGMNHPSDRIYTEIKKEIVKRIQNIKKTENPLMESFMEIPVSEIITTNYDYLLERAYKGEPCIDECRDKIEKGSGETKYSLYRYTTINGRRFYHIHGELLVPDSLCLGSEHYAGYLSKIQSSFKRGKEIDSDHIMMIIQSSAGRRDTWVDSFFNKDIHVVGLGLDQCEIDLWWIVTYRAFLFFTDLYGARKFLQNRIVYYDIVKDNEKPYEKAKRELLRHNLTLQHVEYYPVDISKDNYISGYEKVIEIIRNRVYDRAL